jgi:hypothetical protein
MKKTTLLTFLITSVFVFTACNKESHIRFKNQVGQVRIDNISFGNIPVGTNIIAGEERMVSIREDEDDFPKTQPISFYMIRGTNMVFLKTRKLYKLDYGQTVNIVLEDTTSVYTP